jgi:hypothetical protein
MSAGQSGDGHVFVPTLGLVKNFEKLLWCFYWKKLGGAIIIPQIKTSYCRIDAQVVHLEGTFSGTI